MGIDQLRVRTEFTFRTTFAPIKNVAARLAELECPSAGIVDPNTWGHVRWEKALKDAGVRAMFGREFSVRDGAGMRPVAWALAEDTADFYRFSSAIEAAPKDQPFDANIIARRGRVIVFSGAALDDPELFDYVDIGPGSLLTQRRALTLAERTGKPLVVTCDNAYSRPDERDQFLAITDRQKTTPQWILSDDELRAQLRCLDDAAWARAVENTREAAERTRGAALREAPLIHVDGDLRALVEQGRQERLAKGHIAEWTPEYAARLERELEIIKLKKYESYFLVVADLVRWAKQHMLVGPGRGSSAGSLLCYLVGITEVDPLIHGLLFERFIDITRADLPDVDIDFNDQKRDKVFDYLAEKYGRENVARVGNINTLKARSAISHVGKRLAIPISATWDVTNVLLEYSSGDSRYGKGLEDTLANTEPGRQFIKRYPEAKLMAALEGHAWHSGVHAAGVIVSTVPVIEYCTVNAEGVAQIDKPDAERLNLLKIDALGLRTLGIIEDAGVVTAEELYSLKLDDPEVLRVLNQRKFSGVFQFEGAAQTLVSAQMRFDNFEAVDHATALARPGPLAGGATNRYLARKAGAEEVTYRHPLLEPILNSTFGVVLYQEQVMRIVREIGQFSWEKTTIIRKAMSASKGEEYFNQQGAFFIDGAATVGIGPELAQEIWHEICTFGAWGMNRCAKGTTEIALAHPNQFDARGVTIEELYRRYKEEPSKWIRQRKLMPVLLCVGEDGTAKPKMAVDIHKTGRKSCVRLTFDDGRVVECTREHKFVINGFWQQCGKAEPGAKFDAVACDGSSTSRALIPKKGWIKGMKWIDGKRPMLNGKSAAKTKFQKERHGTKCEDCDRPGREAHHNDFVGGNERPEDLVWLCSRCHKNRHIAHGDRRPPYARGHRPTEPAILVSIEDIGEHETYDIEMPAPDHNYVLANGIVTHNSHTVSYATISYWCLWMKRYHQMEYAAACLRSAKDDESALGLLRELHREGIEFIPFDIEKSEVDWAVKDGQLIGGFKNVEGYGPVKAVTAVEERRLGTLDHAKVLAAPVKFTDLFPLHRVYGDIYKNPGNHGIIAGWKVLELAEVAEVSKEITEHWKQLQTVVFICEVLKSVRRDENEAVRIGRRGGKVMRPPTLFLDLLVNDDSGTKFTLRVGRYDWEPLGRTLADNVRVGDVLLVAARKLPGFNMVIARRIRCLSRPEILNYEASRAASVGQNAQPQGA